MADFNRYRRLVVHAALVVIPSAQALAALDQLAMSDSPTLNSRLLDWSNDTSGNRALPPQNASPSVVPRSSARTAPAVPLSPALSTVQAASQGAPGGAQDELRARAREERSPTAATVAPSSVRSRSSETDPIPPATVPVSAPAAAPVVTSVATPVAASVVVPAPPAESTLARGPASTSTSAARPSDRRGAVNEQSHSEDIRRWARGLKGSAPGSRTTSSGIATPVENSASASDAIGLTRAVENAVQTHPSVRQAIGFLGQSNEFIDVAKAGYYPQIQGGVRSEYDNSQSNPYDRSMVQKAVVSASQMLYDFGKVSSAVEEAQAQRAASSARVLLSIDQLTRETTYAFIEAQRYRALADIARKQVERVSAIADLARKRRALGASTYSDETQAQSREASARATLLEMESQAQTWLQNLAYLSGLAQVKAVQTAIPDAFEIACVPTTPTWGLLPELLVAEAERAQALAALEGAGAQTLPTLSIEGSVGRALNASTQSGRRDDAMAMLNFSMPFYQGGSLGAQKRAAQSVLGAADAATNNARLTASRGLIEARNRAQGFQQRIGTLSERIETIMLTRDLYREQYLNLGTRSLLDLLNAEQEFHQSLFENTNNIHDMRRMQTDCLYSSGHIRKAFELDTVGMTGANLTP